MPTSIDVVVLLTPLYIRIARRHEFDLEAFAFQPASLSTLLWRDTAARHGVHVSAWRWSTVGLRIGASALFAATVVHLAVS